MSSGIKRPGLEGAQPCPPPATSPSPWLLAAVVSSRAGAVALAALATVVNGLVGLVAVHGDDAAGEGQRLALGPEGGERVSLTWFKAGVSGREQIRVDWCGPVPTLSA